MGAVVLGMLLAGCTTAGLSPNTDEARPAADAGDPIVVALLDTGANPYQPIFFRAGFALPEEIAVEETLVLHVETHPDEGRKLDAAELARVETGALYHFRDTRLLAVTFWEDAPERPIDYAAHGAGTSYLVAREAPEAIVVMVQVLAGSCADRTRCNMDPSVADGMEWAAAQPWIDVISLSIGLPGNPPDPSDIHPEAGRFLAASRAAVSSGKIVVVGAGNTPATTHMSYLVGPPWVIGVGGIEPHSTGQSLASSATGFDVSANYTEYAGNFHEMGYFSGTSMATPVVAGTLAHAWGLVRAAGQEPAFGELRAALNASATIPAATDYRPGIHPNQTFPNNILRAAAIPILSQAQVGWGYVTGALSPEIARRVLEDDLAIPPEKLEAELHMTQNQRAREEYWARAP